MVFLPKISKFKMMGVINLTPDSFSDPDYNLSATDLFNSDDILDIGLESTAPMNDVIDAQTEKQRFDDKFMPFVDSLLISNLLHLSFDTYKIEVIEYILEELEAYPFKIIWNDVSGHLSEDLVNVLNKYPRLEYVYCYNLAGESLRGVGARHMEYIDPSLGLNDVVSAFTKARDFFISHGIRLDRIYFDPCFGFAKTHEQNLMILENIEEIFKLHPKWVYGISKKSFLRKIYQDCHKTIVEDRRQLLELSESIHEKYLESLRLDIAECSEVKQVLVRVHNPLLFHKIFDV